MILDRASLPDFKTVRIVATSVAATLIVLLAGFAVWRFYAWSRLGWIVLTSDGTPLRAQVLAESGDVTIGEPFDLVTQVTLALPAGDYQLRVSAVGRLSRAYRFAVNRGETQTHPLSLDEGRLLGGERDPNLDPFEKAREAPMPFAPVTVALELTPGKADLVEWTGQALIRRDGVSGNPVWDASRPDKPRDPARDPVAWIRRLAHAGDPMRPGRLVKPAPDLNGDGTGDLVWAIEGTPSFVAVSGADGSLLWTFSAKPDGPGGPAAAPVPAPRPGDPVPQLGRLFADPVLSDVDGDGIVDVIAAFAILNDPRRWLNRRGDPRRGGAAFFGLGQPNTPVVVAVSGRTGRWLWNYSLPARRRVGFPSPHGRLSVLSGRKGSMLALNDGSQWIGLAPATGQARGQPIELGFFPERPLEYKDLDGDGEPDVLALGPFSSAEPLLAAISSRTGALLWKKVVSRADYPQDPSGLSHGPLVADLDGDGRPEVVVPDHGLVPPEARYGGVCMLDGATGASRWTRPLSPVAMYRDGLYHFLVSPDLDGDGTRDLVVLSRFRDVRKSASSRSGLSGPEPVFVDALSGKDGHSFWSWSAELPQGRATRIGPLHWWGCGPDGWPLLAVSLGTDRPGEHESGKRPLRVDPPAVHVLEATSGREVHTVTGLTNTASADLDGDGLADLWGEAEGQLRAFRGEAPEAWRSLGRFGPASGIIGRARPTESHPAADLDGDGIADTLIAELLAPEASSGDPAGSRTAIARSGRDGRVIWKSTLRPARGWFEEGDAESYSFATYPLPAGDLDGDGTPDVIVEESLPERPYQARAGAAYLPLSALSGRTGGQLWSSVALPRGFVPAGYSGVDWVEVRSIEPGRAPDLLVRHGDLIARAFASRLPPTADRKPHLARISGRDGRVIWDIPLVESPAANWVDSSRPGFDDLDGDGILDVALVIPPSLRAADSEGKVAAISLASGKTIWSRPILSGALPMPMNLEIALGDLDGDNRRDVVFKNETLARTEFVPVVTALSGRDGTDRWTWHGRDPYWGEPVPSLIVLADLDGKGMGRVCIDFKESPVTRRLVILDSNGRESERRQLPEDATSILRAADLDGDGRDELLLAHGGRLRAWGSDLQERWSWPDFAARIERILPASPGRPATVVIDSAVGLDGLTGHPRWAGQAPLKRPAFLPMLLDPGDSARPPLVISQGHGTTVCRAALPTAAPGRFAPPRGVRIRLGPVRSDPRWTRPLPWMTGVAGVVGHQGFVAVGALALVNLVLPLLILRLARGRRPWSLRYLMTMPVAVAIPLAACIALEPLILVLPDPLPSLAELLAHVGEFAGFTVGPYARLFLIGTVAGIPVVAYLALVGWTLIRRQWKRLAIEAILTLLAALAIGAAWLWLDMLAMPSIEHYSWSGWYQLVSHGAYAVGAVAASVWAGRGVYGFVTRPSMRRAAA